jgi:hypothetical protein
MGSSGRDGQRRWLASKAIAHPVRSWSFDRPRLCGPNGCFPVKLGVLSPIGTGVALVSCLPAHVARERGTPCRFIDYLYASYVSLLSL